MLSIDYQLKVARELHSYLGSLGVGVKDLEDKLDNVKFAREKAMLSHRSFIRRLLWTIAYDGDIRAKVGIYKDACLKRVNGRSAIEALPTDIKSRKNFLEKAAWPELPGFESWKHVNIWKAVNQKTVAFFFIALSVIWLFATTVFNPALLLVAWPITLFFIIGAMVGLQQNIAPSFMPWDQPIALDLVHKKISFRDTLSLTCPYYDLYFDILGDPIHPLYKLLNPVRWCIFLLQFSSHTLCYFIDRLLEKDSTDEQSKPAAWIVKSFILSLYYLPLQLLYFLAPIVEFFPHVVYVLVQSACVNAPSFKSPRHGSRPNDDKLLHSGGVPCADTVTVTRDNGTDYDELPIKNLAGGL